MGCEGNIAEAYWVQAESRLSLLVKLPVGANEVITVKIPDDVGIQPPEFGLASVFEDLQVKANVRSGIIPGMSIQRVQPIGYFEELPKMTYQVPDIGEPIELNLEFKGNLHMFKEDTLSILLSGFERNDEDKAVFVPVQPSCGVAMARWSDRRLNITFGTDVQAALQHSIQLPKVLGLSIPKFGIPLATPTLNYPGYRSDVKSSSGLVQVQAAGRIFDTSLCVYTSFVRTPAKIKVLFNMSMPLLFGDVVSVYLPGFYASENIDLVPTGSLFKAARTGCDVPDVELVTMFPPPIATWDAVASTINFVIAIEQVPPFAYYHFVLEKYLEIGKLGLRKPNNPEYHISVRTQVPVGLAKIEVSPGVGAFMHSLLAFTPRLSNEDVDIVVEFQYSFEINVGARVWLEVPGFNITERLVGDPRQLSFIPKPVNSTPIPFNTSGDGAFYFSHGTWDRFGSPPLLQFECVKEVTRGHVVQIIIPRAVGIKLPPGGITPEEQGADFKIYTDAIAGPLPPTTLLTLSALGSFARSEVMEVSSTVAGTMSSIQLAFTSQLLIEKGASLLVLLRGWSRRDNSDTILSVESAHEVDNVGQIPQGTRVLAPTAGSANDIVWMEAEVENINKDGTIQVQWKQDLDQTTRIFPATDLRLAGVIEFDQLIWHPETSHLEMYFSAEIMPKRRVFLTLPITHGFRVPVSGLTPTESYPEDCRCGTPWTACECADVIYQLHSRTSPIDPRPFTKVPGIGIFLTSSLVFVPPEAPHRHGHVLPVELVFTFRVNGVLSVGDRLQIRLPDLIRIDSFVSFNISGVHSSLLATPTWDSSADQLSVVVAQVFVLFFARIVVIFHPCM